MLTQAMPALVKALDGVLPPEALKQLTQALGNCNQPLTSRSGLNVQSPNPANDRGVIVDPPWDPRLPPDYPPNYPPLFPDSGPNNYYVDVPGWSGPGGWNMNNYAGNSFNFSTPQEFNLANYYGAPTFNVGGNSFFDTVSTTNINTTNINGYPVRGQDGTDGATGPSGPPGAAGRDAEVPDFALALMANLRFIRHLPPNLANVIVGVRATDRLPTQAFGNVTADGDPTVDLPNYEVAAQALDAASTAPHNIDIPTYEITGDIPLTASLTETQAVSGFIDLPTGITGTASFSASDIDLEAGDQTLAIDADVDVPTTIEGSVTVSGTVDVPDVAGTVSITGSVTVDVLEGETVTCEIQLPKYVFDPETCALTLSEDETYTASVQVPKFGVTSNTLGASHALSLSAETNVTCTIAATADATGLFLGEVQPLPVTGTVPKLRVASETISVSHQLSLSGTGATAPLSLRDGTVPRLEVASFDLAVSKTGDTEEVSVDLPVYSLPALTATPDGEADIDMDPVSYTFTGIPTVQRYVTDIVVNQVPAPVTPVFTP
jgi:hypothetical protein